MTQTKPYVTTIRGRRQNKSRLVIVNKFRFVFATVLTLILLSTVLTYSTGALMSIASTDQTTVEITVVAGDTLWNIASQYNYYDEDIRQVIYNIKTHNHLASSEIFPGQILAIPVSGH